MKRYGFILAMLILMAIPAMAQTVTFAWDPHPEAAQLTGFKLFQSKTSWTYGATPVATFTGGALTTGTIPKPGLGRYFYVLTAFTPDVESDFSNEVSLVVKPQKPNLKSAVQSAALLPVKGAVKFAGLFKGKKNLRIIEE
jgi:hypothetical protein